MDIPTPMTDNAYSIRRGFLQNASPTQGQSPIQANKNLGTRDQCYKTFYIRNLRIFIIS